MSDTASRPVLYVIVCAAGPASHVERLVAQAQERGWDVCVIPSPNAVDFMDAAELENLTGHPVRSRHRKPGEAGSLPKAQAIIVAPATYNTLNKWALGIADNYPLGLLAELVPLGVPTVVLPFINSALAANPPLSRSISDLRAMGVRVLYGPGEFEPHPPGTGGSRLDSYPWNLALDAAEQAHRNASSMR
ncbi:flavoprotein [Actinomadura rupiterrae]|uniref:flavoprotein n=1 Tax=Actinomadura rupiterrae TaxID=559627 RepID=UPI0020A3E09F|nr:flavoprotein [Actinomadura rupiterrae]MCP2342733.1 phosphopantothenoylcysteine synthetase/decarboxylase [Actinomadura rupiterrae]